MTSHKPLPLEARLKELRPLLLKVECSSEPSDWSGIRTVTTNWYRNPEGREAVAIIDSLLSSYEAQGERLREVEGAAAEVLALPEAVKALEYLAKGIGTKTRDAAWLRLRQAALTQPPAMENGE